MRNGFRLFLMAVGVAACAAAARAGMGDTITFDTLDGVTLEGTFYKSSPQAPAKDRNATVLILTNIGKGGGGRAQDNGWDALAQKLSDEGYSVLSFDFRGFGNSHTVSKTFWDPTKSRHNVLYVKGANKNPPPPTIDHADFDSRAEEYYPWLVNDVVAAKSYLDRQTDRGLANSSNLVLVGAGEGATIGAMWMASQMHLKRFSGIVNGRITLDDPEGRDEAGALWLSISPHLGGRTITGAERNWLVDVAADNKVPMAFLFGEKDETDETTAKEVMQRITNRVHRDNPSLTADALKDKVATVAVEGKIKDSKLSGSALLGEDSVPNLIVKGVGELIEKRGPKEGRSHTLRDKDTFYWTFPNRPPVLAKTELDENIEIVPATTFIQATSGD